jgi:LemA protein
MSVVLWVLLVVIAVIVLTLILLYNRLVVLRNRIKNAWSQIDVQLKRRYDLIPNLIETVKAYAKHEKSVFENVSKARSALMNAKSLAEKAKANDQLTSALKSLFAVAEAYPTLRASENFMQLQEELSGTESKIAYSRQFYNDTVMMFNNAILKFPNNIFAGIFGFKEQEFFKTEEKEKEPVKVKFD